MSRCELWCTAWLRPILPAAGWAQAETGVIMKRMCFLTLTEPHSWPLWAVLLLGVVTAAPASGQDGPPANALFAEALTHERGLREPGVHPTLDDLRAAMSRYDEIIRRFPGSAFDDHSLWQSAGLAIEAYDLYRGDEDLERGRRLLLRLEANHPKSSFAARVQERRAQLDALTRVARLEEIRRERLPDAVRVTIAVDREVGFSSDRLTDPSRLFFDLRGTEAFPTLRNATIAFSHDNDIVREVRLGRHPNQVTRVVLDTEDAESCHTFTLYEPFRLVIDCQRGLVPPADLETAETGSVPLTVSGGGPVEVFEGETEAASPPAANSDGVFSVARQLGLGVSRIVIDPGHGGHDPGARAGGLAEADLVLDIALRLERRLNAARPGLDVVLTRRDDQYVPLEERTTLANHVGADLFLSIHANASDNLAARGVETYFLDFTGDPAAESLAARENVAGLATMQQLDGLLEAIAANSKLDESRNFAHTVQTSILGKLREVDPGVPDLGVKQAPFVVLIGARMPSVLSEVSFLTNAHDARLLSTDDYRDRIADALFDGIQRYQQSLGMDAVIAVADNDGV